MHVSIVIPTRNGMPQFERVLAGILAQSARLPFEVYCVDTASTDGTWEVIERSGVRRKRIARHQFQHGRTRNEAIGATSGELVVCTVQDALPADDQWLQHLVAAALSEPDAAGAYSRQVPYPDCNPFLRRRLENWAAGRTSRTVQRLAPQQRLADLPPLERLARCAFDDVASCMKRSVWRQFPLPARRFGEDVAWAKSVIEAGRSLVFEPRSTVVHSHDDGVLAEFKRIYLDHANLHELFQVTTVPNARDAWRNSRSQWGVYRSLLAELDLGEGEREQLAWYARRYAFAETFAQWLGARSVRKGPPRGLFRAVERFVAG